MQTNLSVSEQLTHSTVRIECYSKSGELSTGTGFFCRFLETEDSHIPAIVTNKHVVQGAWSGKFHLNLADTSGRLLPTQHKSFVLDNFQARWIAHPENNVDLCIMPIAPLLTQAQQQEQRFFYIPLDKSLIPEPEELADLTAMEDVVMIGYPNGIWDSVNNAPVIRKGITATHPNLDYNGKQEFMIDAACFPGSSGSPVFLFNFGSYATKSGGTVIGSRLKLLGVLYAGPQHTATGEIRIVNVPTQQRPIALSQIPNNLGVVIQSRKLLDFASILERIA